MDGSRIQSLVNRGYALSAQRVGLPHNQFRPSGPGNPLVPANLVQTLPAAFSADNYAFRRPQAYATPVWTALVDGSQTQVGDYLVGAATWFVAAQDPLLPIEVVQCNATGSFVRPSAAGRGGGRQGYGGDVKSTEASLLTAWPMALLQGTKGERGDVPLPGDVRMPWFTAFLPSVGGVELLTDDILLDGDGHRYKLSSTEKSPRGWRLTLMLAES